MYSVYTGSDSREGSRVPAGVLQPAGHTIFHPAQPSQDIRALSLRTDPSGSLYLNPFSAILFEELMYIICAQYDIKYKKFLEKLDLRSDSSTIVSVEVNISIYWLNDS